MVPEMIFVEDLNKILEKLSVAPVDDDPTKIYTRAMIRDIKEKYQTKIDEFDSWITANEAKAEKLEAQQLTLNLSPEGGTVVSTSSEKANLAHPGAFPGA